MVALVAKQEKKAVKLWDYMNDAMDTMTIDGDEFGAFCLVPSERKDVRYKIRFAEPAKGEHFVPYATDCSCYDHRTNHNTCKHMHIVNTYYQMIYGIHSAPAIYEEVAPVAVKVKKIRRSAARPDVVAALQVAEGTKIRIAQVRKAMSSGTKLSANCQQSGTEVSKAA